MKRNSVHLSILVASTSICLQLNADISGVITQPSLKKNNTEASPNEFPRTVGTIKQDDSGFELSWNNTSEGLNNFASSVGNVLCKLDIFGLFAISCAQQAISHEMSQRAQDKFNEVADISHHHSQVNIQSADEGSGINETKTEKLAEKLPEHKEAINNNLVAAKSEEDDGDWRKHRKWWQRGTPVL